MADRFISDLVGTLKAYFRIGSLRIKNDSNVLAVKNTGDTGYLPVALSSTQYKNGTGTVTLQTPIDVTYSLVLPSNDGSTNEVLSTDGSGNLSWASVATSSNQVLAQTENVVYNSSTPIVVFTPPANSVIQKVIVDVDTLFDATSVNLSVGVAGTTSKYLGTNDVDLATVAVYEVEPMFQEDGTPEEVIITFAPGSAGSTGSCNVTILYSNPG